MAVTDAVAPDLRAKARAAALKHGVDPDIFERQIARESGYNPNAVSPKGAVGVAQFMPETAKEFGVDPRDPDTSLDAAARKMRGLVDRYKGDYRLALAGYNAGEGNVAKAGGGVPNIPETRAYVNALAPRGTVADLGRAVKRKFPQYAALDDAELGRRIKAKHSAYADFTDVPAAPAAATQAAPGVPLDAGERRLAPAPVAAGTTSVVPRATMPPVTENPTVESPQETASRRRQIAVSRAFPEALSEGFTGPPGPGQPTYETAQSRLAQFESLSPAAKAALRFGKGVVETLPSLEESSRGRSAAIPEPTTTAERIIEGLGGLTAFGGEALALSPLGPAAAAGIPALAQAGTTEQRNVRGLVMGLAGLVPGAAGAVAGKAGAGPAATAAVEHAAGAGAFGAAPWVEAASYHALGHKDAPWPTAREMIENIGLLVGVGAASHAAGRAVAGERPSARAPAIEPEKVAGFKAIEEQLKEPPMPDVPAAVQAKARNASAVATDELNKQLRGTRMSFQHEGVNVSGDYAYGRVYAYPGEPAQVRIVVQDPQSGQMVPFAFRDLKALRAAVGARAEARPETQVTPETPASAQGRPTAEPVAAPPRTAPETEVAARGRIVPEGQGEGAAPVEVVGGGQEPKGGPAASTRPEPAPAAEPPARQSKRSYQRGEVLNVPYFGKSKTATSEHGIVEGYTEVKGEPHVIVRVRKGKTTETRTVPESAVRRVATVDRGPAAKRKPGLTALLREQAGGSQEKAAGFYESARLVYERAEHEAKHLNVGTEAYDSARRKLRTLQDQVDVARSVAYETGWQPPMPENVRVAGDTFSSFGVGALHKKIAAIYRDWAGRVDAKTLPVERPEHVQRVLDIIKSAEPLRAAQEEMVHAEKSERAKRGAAVTTTGERGFYAELAQLKGEHGKVPWEAREQMAQTDVDALFRAVRDHPDLQYFETIAARNGLQKLLGFGEVPTHSELALLEKVFGSDFVDEVLKQRPTLVRLRELGYEIANVPRALMASFDLSAPLRQGLFLGAAYPKHFTKAFGQMFGQFASEKTFRASMEEIASRPTYELMKKSGLALTDLGRFPTAREEAFIGGMLAEKIPLFGRGVRASNRAYSGFLNRLRADAFDSLVRDARALGRTDAALPRKIAEFVNTASGRGESRFLRQHMIGLNALFFSPRFIASRVQLLNPGYYVTRDPVVRRAAVRGLFTLGGAATTILTLAALGGAQVSNDPRRADWAKLRVGNVRYDILGGFQQFIRFAAQMVMGPESGTRWDTFLRFVEGKTAPVVNYSIAALRGTEMTGEKFRALPSGDITKPETWKAGSTLSRFVPMMLADSYAVAKEAPEQLPFSVPASTFGAGVQAYNQQGRRQQRPQRQQRMR